MLIIVGHKYFVVIIQQKMIAIIINILVLFDAMNLYNYKLM